MGNWEKYKSVYLSIFFGIYFAFPAHGQKVFSNYPFLFDQLFWHTNVLNPAAKQDHSSIQVGYNGFNALSNTISTYYAKGYWCMGKDSAYKPHGIGVNLINDQEGQYLNRLKIIAQYAVHIKLSRNVIWSAGIGFGFLNSSLKANAATGGESVFAPEGDIGTWIHWKGLQGGVALNQLFDNKIKFFNSTYYQYRFATFTLSYEIQLNHALRLKPAAWIRTGPDNFNKYAFSVGFSYKKFLLLDLTGKSDNGLILTAGVQQIPFMKNYLRFLFSYRFPLNSVIISASGNAELMLAYYFKNRGLHNKSKIDEQLMEQNFD